MKRILIGCGALLLIVMLVAGLIVWRMLAFGLKVNREMQRANEVYRALERDYPFNAIAGQKVDGLRFEQWLNIAHAMMEQSHRQQKDLEQMAEAGSVWKSPRFMQDNIIHLFTGPADLLQRHRMPLSEFNWIRDQLLQTLASDEIDRHPTLAPLGRPEYAQASTWSDEPRIDSSGAMPPGSPHPGDRVASGTVPMVELPLDQSTRPLGDIANEKTAHMLRLIELHREKLEPLLDYLASGELVNTTEMPIILMEGQQAGE